MLTTTGGNGFLKVLSVFASVEPAADFAMATTNSREVWVQ